MNQASTASLPPGTTIAGRYRIEGTVGRGGFGAVYDATQLDSGRRVALKILLKNFSTSKTDARRFQREAALVQKLRHPNVVDIYDFGYTELGQPYIAFELLKGVSLGDAIKEHGPLPFPRAATVARDVLEALGAAHGVGIIHRDIKPQNIFLCQHGAAKVLDFGIAKAVRGKESQATQLTETGQMLGTPQYMAPEQVRGADIVPATDLYALGLLFAEMISGERVVSGGALIDVYMAHITDDPFKLPAAVTNSPAGAVIRKAISKSLDERFASANEMLTALDAALGMGRPSPTNSGVGQTTQMREILMGADFDPLNSTVLITETAEIVEPAEDEDSLAQTAYQSPSSDHPSSGHPSSGHPRSGHPSSGHPSSDHPSSGQPHSGHPSSGQPPSRQVHSLKPMSTQPLSAQPPMSLQPRSLQPQSMPAQSMPAQSMPAQSLPRSLQPQSMPAQSLQALSLAAHGMQRPSGAPQERAQGTMVMDSGAHAAQLAALKAGSHMPSADDKLNGTVEMGPSGPSRAWPQSPPQAEPSLRASMHEGRPSVPPGLNPPRADFLSQPPLSPAQPRAMVPLPPKTSDRRRPNRWWVWLLLILALAGAGAAMAMWAPWQRAARPPTKPGLQTATFNA